MKKRILSMALALTMCFTMLPTAAFAEGTPESADSGEVATCICETKCTEGEANPDCPVCGAEDADLTLCTGTEQAESFVTSSNPEEENTLTEAQQAFVTAVSALDKAALLELANAYKADPTDDTETAFYAAYDKVEGVDGTSASELYVALLEDEQAGVADSYAILQDIIGSTNAILGVDVSNEAATYEVTYDENGIGSDGSYEPAVTAKINGRDTYQIENAGNLAWFSQEVKVNTGGTPYKWNAVLTADIDLSSVCYPASDGKNEKSWLPIGRNSAAGLGIYCGIFDGQGHTISNLYINDTTNYSGLFSRADESGKKPQILNLNLTNVNVTGKNWVGAIVGYYNGKPLCNCTVQGGTISGTNYVGGIVGDSRVSFFNCLNTAAVSGNDSVGGILGQGDNSIIANCLNVGSVTATSKTAQYVGAVCGMVTYGTGAVSNTCYIAGRTTKGGNAIADLNSIPFHTGELAQVTEEDVKIGKATYLLNGDQKDIQWYQNIDNGSTEDDYPVLDSSHGIVYKSGETYSNTGTSEIVYTNGFAEDGSYQKPAQDENNYYLIENAGNLYWFANAVNTGDKDSYLCAKLTQDVVDNASVLTNGSLTSDTTNLRTWTPIGYQSETDSSNFVKFRGIFDGNGHTISGLYYDGNAKYAGLFGYVVAGPYSSDTNSTGNEANIKNLGILNSYFKTTGTTVGAICGYNYGAIENCYNNGSVVAGGEATDYVGGICGWNAGYRGAFSCWNSGAVSGGKYRGGICGANGNGTVIHVTGPGFTDEDGTGDIEGGTGSTSGSMIATIKNCYNSYETTTIGYMGGTLGATHEEINSSNKTADQFASGEVTYLLNGGTSTGSLTWYQNVDTSKENYPTFDNTHSKVYKLTCTKYGQTDSTLFYSNGALPSKTHESYKWVDANNNEVTSVTADAVLFEKGNKMVVSITGLSAATGLTYNGNAQNGYTGTAVCKNGDADVTNDCGTLLYTYYKSTGENTWDSGTTTAPTNAGTYKLVVSVADTNETYAGSSMDIIFAVGKAAGSIANKDYNLTPTYTGNAVADPVATNFTTDGTDLSFAWYSGETKLDAAPSAVGSYTLRVTSTDSANYAGTTQDFTVKIDYLKDAPDATLADANKGENDWYTGEVMVNAPSGYTISQTINGTYTASFTTTTNGDVTYYLKQDTTGYITDAKTIKVNYDADKPTIGTIIYSEHSSFLDWIFGKSSIEVTVPVTDATSGADHIAYTLTADETNGTLGENTSGTANVNGNGNATFTISKDFKGSISITAYDKAGNASTTSTVVKMAVEETKPTLSTSASGDSQVTFTSDWYTTAQTIYISAQDEGSGLSSVSYTVDGGEAKPLYTAPSTESSALTTTQQALTITVLEGTHTYKITATDNAMNTTDVEVIIKQDTVAPTKPTLAITTAATDTTVTLTASDVTETGSGIKEYTLTEASGKITAQTNTTGVFALTGLTPGAAYSFTVTATDNAGNQSDKSDAREVNTLKSAQAALTITGKPDTITYGDSFTLGTGGGTGDGAVTWAVTAGNSATVDTTGEVTITGVGETTITATKAGGDQYENTSAIYTFTPAAKVLTPSISGTTTKVYDGTTTAPSGLSIALAGKVSGDESAVTAAATSYTYNSADVVTANTITANGIALSGNKASCYTLNGVTTATIAGTITQSTPTIAFNNYAPDRDYNGAALANPTEAQLSITGATYENVTYTWHKDSASGEILTGKPVNAGNYVLVASIAETDNTAAASATSGAISISKAALTITAKPQTITYGNEIDKAITQVTVGTGLVNNEELTGITLTASTANVPGGTIAPSAATISGNGAGNYNITYNTGVLTINKADPSYTTPTGLTATYGDTLANVALPTGIENGAWSWKDLTTTSVGNVGNNSFTAVFTPTDTANYNTKEETVSIAVAQADSAIGAVTYTGSTLYDSMELSEVVLTRANTAVPGTLTLDAGQTLTTGTNNYNWTFTPNDTTNYNGATGTISLTVAADTLQSISIGETVPSKTAYTYGDTFETAGLTVTATYAHRAGKDVTANVTFGTLSGGDTSIALSYTDGDVTKTCEVTGLTVNKQKLDVSGMSWTDGSYTYNGNVQGVTLNGTLPAGVTVVKANDSATNKGNYTATATFALAEGYDAKNYEITGTNPLTKDWSIAQASLTGTKNPGFTLRYTTTAVQTVSAADFGITAAGSFTANGAVTDAKNVLNATPIFAANVQYQLKTDLTFNSQIVTIPVTFTPADTNYAPVNLTATITLTDRNTVTLNLTASKATGVIYGDSVTYTATLDKDHKFLDALDTLDGEIKFYLGDPANGGTLLDTKTISGSGSTASVTLNFDKLTKGDHTVYAVYGGNTAFANNTANTTTSVEAKALTWDVSGLWAAKQYKAGDTSATVNGTLLVSGALEGTDPGFTCTGLTGSYASDAVGSQTVTVTVEGKKLSNANYELPTGNPTFTGTINAVDTLTPPASENGKDYKLEQEQGISEVPAGLTGNTALNTPAKIETQMKLSITDANGNIPTANIEVYDVTLKFSTDNGATWTVATGDNFPANGITVVLPYPTGTSQSGYDFVITHMFTTGAKAGTTETITPTKTANGLQFTLMSLSPVAVGYKTSTPADNGNGGNGGGSSTTTYYTITTSAGAGGYFSTGTTVKVPAGDSAGFTITPNKGYSIADVLVDGKSVGAVSNYVFTNVRANHTISATFKAAGHTNPQTGVGYDFTDVAETDWFYEDVMTACDNGWFAGTSATTFSPYASMTRQMLWTVLGRINGENLSGSGVYAAARTWAMTAGITDGSNPTAALTREQLVTILWRYAGSPAASGDLAAFSDANTVAAYATDAMKWAVANGIVAGADGKLMPQGNATRAQVAAILNRYDEKFGK